MTSIFEGNPPEQRFFQTNQGACSRYIHATPPSQPRWLICKGADLTPPAQDGSTGRMKIWDTLFIFFAMVLLMVQKSGQKTS